MKPNEAEDFFILFICICYRSYVQSRWQIVTSFGTSASYIDYKNLERGALRILPIRTNIISRW